MKKQLIAAALLIAPLTVPAQQPKAYLLDRREAIAALPTPPANLALVEFREGQRAAGRVAVVINGQVTSDKLQAALILSLGIVFEQPQPERCNSTTRGESCTGDARGFKQ
jgi:hypothetical protein